jgi:transposase InsO family protein
VDGISRMVYSRLLDKTPNAQEALEFLSSIETYNLSLIRDVLTDQGTQFCSKHWLTALEISGVTAHLASVGYPQGDGITERAIQNIKLLMRMAGFEQITIAV